MNLINIPAHLQMSSAITAGLEAGQETILQLQTTRTGAVMAELQQALKAKYAMNSANAIRA